MQILLVAATQAEVQPLIDHFCLPEEEKGKRYGSDQLRVLITGVGMTATAYALTKELCKKRYDLVLNAGIAGSFDRNIKLGEVVAVQNDCFAELGAEDGQTFLPIFEMGFLDKNEKPFSGGVLKASYSLKNFKGVHAITVNKVHGNEESIEALKKHYTPQVESMEGAAVFYVAILENTACAQFRAISNYVERRNRAAWNIPLAIRNLNDALINYVEEHGQKRPA